MMAEVKCTACGSDDFIQLAKLKIVNPTEEMIKSLGMKPDILPMNTRWVCNSCGSDLMVAVHNGLMKVVNITESGTVEV